MRPFYCEGPAHDATFPAPVLGYADNPEHVHALCSVCGPSAREAQSSNPRIPLGQFAALSKSAARAKLEAGHVPLASPPLPDLPTPGAPLAASGPVQAV